MSARLRRWFIFLLFGLPLLSKAQEYTIGTEKITACEGSFFDSGGLGGDYQPGEILTTTICSDGTGGSHIRMVFESLLLASGDTLYFYDGPDTNATRRTFLAPSFNGKPYIMQSSAANPGGCLTIQFKSDLLDEGLGWSATFMCIQSCQNIQSTIAVSEPPLVPQDTGYINTCPGSPIQLSGAGLYPQNNLTYVQSDETSTFRWEMGDGTIYYGQNIEHTYDKPGGYIAQLTVTDAKGCTNTNYLHQRIRIAEKPVVTFDASEKEVCLGTQLTSTMSSVIPQEGTFSIRGFRADSLALPDGNGTSYETSIEFSQFSPGQTLPSGNDILGVCVNMEHSWLRDLEIKLSCPSGKSITLHNFAGEEGSGIFLGQPVDFDGTNPTPGLGYDYCWTPNATNGTWLEYVDINLYNEDTLPSGDYSPYQSFDLLAGCPLNGKWTIQVTDLWSWDNGYIFSWGINFASALLPIEENFTPGITDYYWTSDVEASSQTPASITHDPLIAGPFSSHFFVEDDYGCTWDTIFNFLALPKNAPDCISCGAVTDIMPDTFVCDGGSVQLKAGPENGIIEEESIFRSLPNYTFNNNTNPLSQPYGNTIDVSGIVPEMLDDPLSQIGSICINMTAPVAEAIHLYLQAPNGRIVELSTSNGGTSSDYQNICFSPGSTRSIAGSEVPLSGTYAAEGNWDILSGSPVNGSWQLLLADDQTTDTVNVLNSWTLTFNIFNKVSYFWSPATGLSCTDCPNPVASPKTTRTYTLMSRDSYDCIDTDTVRVRVITNEKPITLDSFQIKMPSCFGKNDGTATVFASGGNGFFNYLWSDSLGQFSQQAVLLQAGTYGVTITDTLGCRLDSEIEVGQPDSLILDFSATDVLCKGGNTGTATALPSGGTAPFTFLWDEGQTDATAVQLAAGNYRVSVTDANGCKTQGSMSVGQPEEALNLAVLQSDSGCFGQQQNQATAIPSGGTGNTYSFSWSDGQTGSTAINLDSLIYRVTVMDVNSCSTEGIVQISDLEPIDFNIIKNEPSCFGYSDGGMGVNIITGGAGQEIEDYSINWSTGASGNFIENLAANQTYGVTVTDSKGCTASKERLLEEPSPLDITFQVNPVRCFGESSGSVSITNLPGNTALYDISWDLSSGIQSGPSATNLAAGTYFVTVIEPAGCINNASVVIPQPNPLSAKISTQSNRCFGDRNGSAEIFPEGGTPEYSYLWNNGAIAQKIENLPAGSYSVTLTDNNGCSIQSSANILQPEGLEASLQIVHPICHDSRDGRAAITVSGGTGPFLYSTNNLDYSPSPVFAGLKGGNYTLFIRDINNCTFQEPFALVAPPKFTIEARASETLIYQGDSVQLQVFPQNSQGEILYTWSTADLSTLSCSVCASPLAKPILTTGYQVNAIDTAGCEAEDRIQINVAKQREIAVPTGFTPNGDGVNDRLLVHGRPGVHIKLFRIFDRWGELLYETGDFDVNDPAGGWDGTFRGEPINSGVYLWHLIAAYPDGSEEPFHGQTTLIR